MFCALIIFIKYHHFQSPSKYHHSAVNVRRVLQEYNHKASYNKGKAA